MSNEDLASLIGKLANDVAELRERVVKLELRVGGVAIGSIALVEVARLIFEYTQR